MKKWSELSDALLEVMSAFSLCGRVKTTSSSWIGTAYGACSDEAHTTKIKAEEMLEVTVKFFYSGTSLERRFQICHGSQV